MKRRNFLKNSALVGGGLALVGCDTSGTNTKLSLSSEVLRWRVLNTLPALKPLLQKMTKEAEVMSAGRIRLEIQEATPSQAFEQVSSGKAEMFYGTSQHFEAKIPTAAFFSAMPFGMNAQQINAWLLYGGGLDLWQEAFAPHKLLPFPCGNTGAQFGFWTDEKLSSWKNIAFQSDSWFTSFLKKTDAEQEDKLQEVKDGYYFDLKTQKSSKYCYYPSFHKPATVLGLFFHQASFENIPPEYQEMFLAQAYYDDMRTLSHFEAQNSDFLAQIETQTEFVPFPTAMLQEAKTWTETQLSQKATQDPFFKKVYQNFKAFQADIQDWNSHSEEAILPYL